MRKGAENGLFRLFRGALVVEGKEASKDFLIGEVGGPSICCEDGLV